MNLFDEEESTNVWDESESADPEADAEAAANDAAAVAAVLELTQGPSTPARASRLTDEQVDESYMDEVDRRLDVASYYRELLSNPLFEGNDENAAIVEREIRQFVNGRLQALLGVKSDPRQLSGLPAKPLFDTNEVQVIKAIINTAPTLLGLSSTFAPRELEALKALAAVALRQKGLVPTPTAPRVQEAPKPRPVLRKTQPPVAVVPPKPQPAPPPVAPPAPVQVQPAPRQGRPALARRTSNRTAPATTATVAPAKAIPALTKEVVHEVNGQEHVTTVPLIQKHPGKVPFPASDRDFQAASDVFAANQARSSEANWSNEGKVSVGHR